MPDEAPVTNVRESEVQAVAGRGANDAGSSVVGVTATGDRVRRGHRAETRPSLALLRRDLNAAGLNGVNMRVNLVPVSYQPLPK
jgi:hypothetical protein